MPTWYSLRRTTASRCRPSTRGPSTTCSSRSIPHDWRAQCSAKDRLARPPADLSGLIDQLQRWPATDWLRWITVSRGADIQLITVEDICYFRADNKYVCVVTADGEALITMSLKELAERLDPAMFWQIHRGVIVNMNAIKSVRRAMAGHLELRLKQRPETLRVSAANAHLFKQM